MTEPGRASPVRVEEALKDMERGPFQAWHDRDVLAREVVALRDELAAMAKDMAKILDERDRALAAAR